MWHKLAFLLMVGGVNASLSAKTTAPPPFIFFCQQQLYDSEPEEVDVTGLVAWNKKELTFLGFTAGVQTAPVEASDLPKDLPDYEFEAEAVWGFKTVEDEEKNLYTISVQSFEGGYGLDIEYVRLTESSYIFQLGTIRLRKCTKH